MEIMFGDKKQFVPKSTPQNEREDVVVSNCEDMSVEDLIKAVLQAGAQTTAKDIQGGTK